MYGLDLFSGIGGIGIAIRPWVRTIAYCEQDKFAQGVLLSRMQSNDIDRAPIFTDVRELRSEHFTTKPDIIFGGFPCQDISVAGAGKGLAGQRSGLFYEIVRLTKEIEPAFVFLENVPAIRTRGLRDVVRAFTEVGYDCRWTCLSAASVGAPHKRERWFLLAHSHGAELRNAKKSKCEATTKPRNNGKKERLAYADSFRKLSKQKTRELSIDRTCDSSENVSDSMFEGLERQWKITERTGAKLNYAFDDSWWSVEPRVGRVANGLPMRSHRIKCLGNSVVPQQVRTAFLKLIGTQEYRKIEVK